MSAGTEREPQITASASTEGPRTSAEAESASLDVRQAERPAEALDVDAILNEVEDLRAWAKSLLQVNQASVNIWRRRERECRDREATEQELRARLADAEAKVERLREVAQANFDLYHEASQERRLERDRAELARVDRAVTAAERDALRSERDALRETLRLRTEALGRVVAERDALRATVESGDASDGYHTHNELYEYRMLYNAHAAHGWLAAGIPVVKSWRHSDGELCFGGGWFVVVASLPTGQVTNHYEAEYWGLFDVPEGAPPEYDGHSPRDAADRLRAALTPPTPEQDEETGQ